MLSEFIFSYDFILVKTTSCEKSYVGFSFLHPIAYHHLKSQTFLLALMPPILKFRSLLFCVGFLFFKPITSLKRYVTSKTSTQANFILG